MSQQRRTALPWASRTPSVPRWPARLILSGIPRSQNEPVLWQSAVELGHDFFQDILRHPFPLDMNVLKALKRSPLGLDLYTWLSYRTFSLNCPLPLSWKKVYRPVRGLTRPGWTDNRTVQDFRKDCLRELVKTKTAWPGLNYKTAKGVLVLAPSTPTIPPVAASPQ